MPPKSNQCCIRSNYGGLKCVEISWQVIQVGDSNVIFFNVSCEVCEPIISEVENSILITFLIYLI